MGNELINELIRQLKAMLKEIFELSEKERRRKVGTRSRRKIFGDLIIMNGTTSVRQLSRRQMKSINIYLYKYGCCVKTREDRYFLYLVTEIFYICVVDYMYSKCIFVQSYSGKLPITISTFQYFLSVQQFFKIE